MLIVLQRQYIIIYKHINHIFYILNLYNIICQIFQSNKMPLPKGEKKYMLIHVNLFTKVIFLLWYDLIENYGV